MIVVYVCLFKQKTACEMRISDWSSDVCSSDLVMMRRYILFMLMSLEIMMNSAALAFVVAGARWQQPDGQIMFILVLALAASEASVGLAILIQLHRRFRTLDVDAASEMKG